MILHNWILRSFKVYREHKWFAENFQPKLFATECIELQETNIPYENRAV